MVETSRHVIEDQDVLLIAFVLLLMVVVVLGVAVFVPPPSVVVAPIALALTRSAASAEVACGDVAARAAGVGRIASRRPDAAPDRRLDRRGRFWGRFASTSCA